MKMVRYFLPMMFLLILLGANSKVYAQSSPVMYFCEKYDEDDGEVGISDRFSTGHLTVMVKSGSALHLTDCHIQFDKWDTSSRKFKFYKKYDFTIERDMKYVFFSKTEGNDMSFDDPGFYRVFLLNDDDETVASALIQIVD